MSYFVTGATGFIGRRLVARLLERGGRVYVLVRPQSLPKFEALREFWGRAARRVLPIAGDLAEPNLGVSAADLGKLKGRVRHLFHLAAVYDLAASAEDQNTANVVGTDHAIQFAESIRAGCFHLVSSIAAAGLYPGTFREDMFEEATGLEHPYFRTKHDSEGLVRHHCRRPWRIYRPGMVVGDSRTGHIDKVDGPYYFFKMIQKLRRSLPQWFPLVGLEGGYINLVPVDFVTAALDHLAHVEGQDGQCFHLTDPRQRRVGNVEPVRARCPRADHGLPRRSAAVRYGAGMVTQSLAGYQPLQQVLDTLLRDLRIPRDVLKFVNWPTRYDASRTQQLLADTDIRVPPLEDYAWRLWDYWERHLDPELSLDRSLAGAVRDKVVLITGGSSGIGLATAKRCAEAGARVIIAARDPDKLEAARAEIAARGGSVFAYPCDLADYEACDAFAARVLAEHGGVDVLVNNAGRSIRRSIELAHERFHDFERLMQLNYYAAIRLTMALLPSMLERGGGHVVSISSIGVLSNAPRFSGYVARRRPWRRWMRCAAAEFADRGLSFTIINMPLVRTPMIAPTKLRADAGGDAGRGGRPGRRGDHRPAEADRDAARHRRRACCTAAPRISEVVMNTAFGCSRTRPRRPASRERAPQPPPNREAMLFASLLRRALVGPGARGRH